MGSRPHAVLRGTEESPAHTPKLVVMAGTLWGKAAPLSLSHTHTHSLSLSHFPTLSLTFSLSLSHTRKIYGGAEIFRSGQAVLRGTEESPSSKVE